MSGKEPAAFSLIIAGIVMASVLVAHILNAKRTIGPIDLLNRKLYIKYAANSPKKTVAIYKHVLLP